MNDDMAEKRRTDRPSAQGQDPLLSELLALVKDLKATVAEQGAELAELKARPSGPPVRGVTREEASQIGAQFWAIIEQAKGEKQVRPVEVRAGSKDSEGDGNIAYRIFRTDEDIKKGGEVYRLPEDLFRSREDALRAAFPRRMSGSHPRGTEKK